MRKKSICNRRLIQSFTTYRRFLSTYTDRGALLHETALFLLKTQPLSEQEEAFKRNFFATYTLELAGPCGCHDVLPAHLRIDNPEKTQILIELMSALRRRGLLGDMTIKQLAKILNCILLSKYSLSGMRSRLKTVLPELEYVDGTIHALTKEIKQKKNEQQEHK